MIQYQKKTYFPLHRIFLIFDSEKCGENAQFNFILKCQQSFQERDRPAAY
jgi:hypothetical protein